MALNEIRTAIAELMSLNNYTSAVFWADKALSLSNGAADDALSLARCLYALGEYSSIGTLAEKYESVSSDLRFILVSARSLNRQSLWEDALQTLEFLIAHADETTSLQSLPGFSARTTSQLWMAKGEAYEGLGNRQEAASAYRRALQLDCFCYEAFQFLVDRHLISTDSSQSSSAAGPKTAVNNNNNDNNDDSGQQTNQSHDSSLNLDVTATPGLLEDPSLGIPSPEETLAKARSLLLNVPTDECCPWIRSLYACKLWQYGSFSKDPTAPFEEIQFAPLPAAFRNNSLVLAAQAERYFYTDQFQLAYDLSKQVIENDTYQNSSALAVYVSSLVELEKTNELYYCAHKLVQRSPNLPISWYAIGSYYHLVGKFVHARRFFGKAVDVDSTFGPTWIGFGHSFSNQGEPDQALAAYYTASRIMPGSHLPLLYIAMEYRRLANHRLAIIFLGRAANLCAADPLIWSEYGVNAYLEGEFVEAIRHFEHCISLLSTQHSREQIPPAWEPVLFNLAHCHRKLGHLFQAKDYYLQCLNLQQKATTYTALGFVEHLLGNFDQAIEYYHQSLGMTPGDTITNGLLDKAIRESMAANK
jgi:anaphase-promoting complex subunit 6